MIQQWKTIKEFKAAPEEGIYFTYINLWEEGEIKIAWYKNDKFYADEEREYGRWWITHVMKITLPNPPNNA